MNDSKILLVGNSPSVLDYNFADKIDNFDIVVRFNNFQLNGYEKHIGTKCTILCRRACDDVKMWPKSMFEKIICFMTYCKWTPWMPQVINQIKHIYQEKLIVIPPSITKITGEKIGLDQPNNQWCSIGVLAIDYFLQEYDHLTIHGFDHLKPEPVNNQILHYYPTPPKDACYHDGTKEEIFINNLIQQNKISRLRSI